MSKDNPSRCSARCGFAFLSIVFAIAIFAATGLQFMELNTLYQLLALKRTSPEVLEAADCLLMMPDFFHWCLSGARVAEFTDATTTQFFDPVKGAWASELLERFELPTKILPEVIAPGTKIGPLLDSLGRRTGLGRIDVIARRQLGLTAPVPGQVAPMDLPPNAVMAQARQFSPQPAQQ